MDAMPPIDYDKFATRTDIESLRAVMDGQFARVDGRFAQIDARFETLTAQFEGRFAETDARITTAVGELQSALATQMRLLLAAQVGMFAVLMSYISAVT